jgi:hypothetical protein
MPPPSEASNGDGEDPAASRLENVLRHHPFQQEPLFAGLRPADPEAQFLLLASQRGERVLGVGDQFWLNRHLIDAAFRQATGRACFRTLDSGLDGVLVSDVGKPMQVEARRRAGGVIRTALRASGILMDRVWQLEKETFQNTPGFVFVPITQVVELSEDPTAVHPEIQRQLPSIRTDLDRFSELEISSLVRHGYCVARKACRDHPALFGAEFPSEPPWDPTALPRNAALPLLTSKQLGEPSRQSGAATIEARKLQGSAFLRIWSTLLDYRDWTSYVYVPLLIPILVLFPYFVVKYYEHSNRIRHLIGSLSQGSGDFEQMSYLLENRPAPWEGEAAEEVPSLDRQDTSGFEVLKDSHIYDLRNWKPGTAEQTDPGRMVYGYRRLKVPKRPENTQNNSFPIDLLARSSRTAVRFPAQQLEPTLLKCKLDGPSSGEKKCRWQARFDFRQLPAGDTADLVVEHCSSGYYLRSGANGTAIKVPVRTETAELTMWVLMPEGKEYRNFRIIRYETKKPEKVESVKLVSEYLPDDYTILAFKLLSLKAGFTYEVSWVYR